MTARRTFSLGLPNSDANTAIIRAWLDAQPAGSDLSALVRERLVAGIERYNIVAALTRIEARLAQFGAREAPVVPAPVEPEPIEPSMLAALLDFDHLR